MSEYERGYAAAREDAAELAQTLYGEYGDGLWAAIRALQPGSPAQPDPSPARLSNEPPANIPENYRAPLDERTTAEMMADRDAALSQPDQRDADKDAQ